MTVTVPSWLLSTYGGWNNLGVVARFVPLNDPTMGCTQIVEAGLSEPMPLATTSFEMQRMLQEREEVYKEAIAEGLTPEAAKARVQACALC